MVKQDSPFEMPRKPEEYNYLSRVINFDIDKCGGHSLLLLHSQTDDVVQRKHKLVLTPLDVIEDGNWFNSKTKELLGTPIRESVDDGFLITASKQSWSPHLDFKIILPRYASRLPAFMKTANTDCEILFRNLIGGAIEKSSTETAIIGAQEREIEMKDQYIQEVSSKPKIFEKEEVEVIQDDRKPNESGQSGQYPPRA